MGTLASAWSSASSGPRSPTGASEALVPADIPVSRFDAGGFTDLGIGGSAASTQTNDDGEAGSRVGQCDPVYFRVV